MACVCYGSADHLAECDNRASGLLRVVDQGFERNEHAISLRELVVDPRIDGGKLALQIVDGLRENGWGTGPPPLIARFANELVDVLLFDAGCAVQQVLNRCNAILDCVRRDERGKKGAHKGYDEPVRFALALCPSRETNRWHGWLHSGAPGEIRCQWRRGDPGLRIRVARCSGLAAALQMCL